MFFFFFKLKLKKKNLNMIYLIDVIFINPTFQFQNVTNVQGHDINISNN